MSDPVKFSHKTKASIVNYTRREFFFPAMSTQENIENIGICLEGVTGLKLTSVVSGRLDMMDFVTSFFSKVDAAKEMIGECVPYCVEVYDYKVYKAFCKSSIGASFLITVEVIPLAS